VCAFFMGYSIDFSRFSTPTGVGSLSKLFYKIIDTSSATCSYDIIYLFKFQKIHALIPINNLYGRRF
ncbi:MAG: hypothetical protein K2P65_08465, partial [Lachnospiraceae bacterium]|nr:hypothetical protein [Lachnospiraceae bacterium]